MSVQRLVSMGGGGVETVSPPALGSPGSPLGMASQAGVSEREEIALT